MGGSVRATSIPVATPIEDVFQVGPAVEVHGDVSTTRLSYTTVSGTIDGSVRVETIDSPGGMGLEVAGTIKGNLAATGGATAEGFLSYAFIAPGAAVARNVSLNLTAGSAIVQTDGSVGGNLRVSAADSVNSAVLKIGRAHV